RHNFLSFCLLHGAQMHVARRAVFWSLGRIPSGFCATRSYGWRDAQSCPVYFDFLLKSARCAAEAGAARNVVLFC
ncbi:hypothetical protein A2U01_0080445, partial [Trifolium medium]|nr:hypothetical protein [Trifolium medium]